MPDPTADVALPRRFEGKTALVTGAASGIGRSTAVRLAGEGASVWCADINASGVAETADSITASGGVARSSAVDVTDPAACAALVADVVDGFGGLDVLANIAGIGGMTHFADETPERFLRIFQVNAAGPFHLSQAALPHLIERKGNILNLASTAGLIGQAYVAAYCASKHALVGLTRAMAVELGRQGVRVNAVCPGGVNTAIMNDFVPPENASMSLISRAFLVREMQEPESVAAMIAYVCSDEAYYVNGSILSIDGGTTAG
jgi:meso-butanediol dehydrogenase / (S,S)-butanediol dehydrogenase / diacetyl reductase